MKSIIEPTEAVNSVFEVIENLLGRTKKEIGSSSREQPIVSARCSVIVVLNSLGFSSAEIGGFVNRDHSSVLHLLHLHEDRIVQLPDYALSYSMVVDELVSRGVMRDTRTCTTVYKNVLLDILVNGLTPSNKLQAKVLCKTI